MHGRSRVVPTQLRGVALGLCIPATTTFGCVLLLHTSCDLHRVSCHVTGEGLAPSRTSQEMGDRFARARSAIATWNRESSSARLPTFRRQIFGRRVPVTITWAGEIAPVAPRGGRGRPSVRPGRPVHHGVGLEHGGVSDPWKLAPPPALYGRVRPCGGGSRTFVSDTTRNAT